MNGMKIIKSFGPKKPYPSWVKNTSTASWESPIGPAPALTEEQEQQNTPPDENTRSYS